MAIKFSPRQFGFVAVVTAALIIFALQTPARAAVKVNEPAPVFSLPDTAGMIRDLSTMQGSIVVLEWTNHGCPYVRKHYDSGNMQSLQEAAAKAGVIWLSVISSAPGKQGYVDAEEAEHLSKMGEAVPAGILLDPEGTLGRQYGAKVTPHLFIIDKGGILRYKGGIDSIRSTDPADVAKADPLFQKALESVIAGDLPDPAVTRPYGCSVKYGE